MNTDRCVSCGEVIPEGREVCGACEGKIVLKTNEQYKKGYEQGVRDFAERLKEKKGDVARIVSGDTYYYLVGKSLIDTTAEELTKGKNNT